MNRTRIYNQTWNIANKLGLTNAFVGRVVAYYIEYCRELIQNNKIITMQGVFTITPKLITDKTKFTNAYLCKHISNEYNLPYNTVLEVIKHYRDNIVQHILDGDIAEIRGLAVLKPIKGVDGELNTVHSYLSQSLPKDIKQNIRIHTYKGLKHALRGLK